MGKSGNKSVETMVLQQSDEPNEIRAMQHFVSEGCWDDEAVLRRHAQEVDKDLGEADGVLIIDGSDFPKQGEGSAGVQRQWCGELGKVANCQAGVFLGYASSKGHTLLDRRLYLSAAWLEAEAYAERRVKCGVPEALAFKKKTTLALEMVEEAQGRLRYSWLCFDEFFGQDKAFLDAIGDYGRYLAEVPKDTHVYPERPRTAVPAYSGRGRKPTRQRVVQGEAPQSVEAIAKGMNDDAWERHTIKEGSKGPLLADFMMLRVVAVRERLPADEVWLILRRRPVTGEIKFYLSNAPHDTPLAAFVRVAGMRWPIESCFEEGKQELGMGDYQLRNWLGWYHHMTLVILAHFFLVRLKLRHNEKVPELTLPQAVLLLKASLPQPEFDMEQAIKTIHYYQERHEAARKSHRKRRLAQLERSE